LVKSVKKGTAKSVLLISGFPATAKFIRFDQEPLLRKKTQSKLSGEE